MFKKFAENNSLAPIILAAIAIGVGLQEYLGGPHRYANFVIFRNSFRHLINHLNLYQGFSDEKDFFLYSPSFALLMAPFVYLPDWLGIVVWCGVNSLAVYFAIRLLPATDARKRLLITFIILFDFISSQQNLQTNPLIASFTVLAFVCFERRMVFFAALFVMMAFYVKIFGLAAASLFLLYPQRIRFLTSLLFWGTVLFLAPLLAVPFRELISLYASWYRLTMAFHENASVNAASSLRSADISLSVMSWLRIWFGLKVEAVYVQLAGAVLFCIPFLCTKNFVDLKFRTIVLSSLLIWCVIFNHIAESPSYIIAMMGVAIWFVNEKRNALTIGLLILALVLTGLSSTDAFPAAIRNQFVKPLVLKAFPCILIWCFIQFRLLTFNAEKSGDRAT